MDYILIALVAMNIIITIVLIAIIQSKKNSDKTESIERGLLELSRSIGNEFQRSRQDSSTFQKDLRDETSKSLNEISQKLMEMTKLNYESQIALTEKISKSLSDIREINYKQNERQNKVLEQSISKLQDSNEKKLEQMRQTVDEKLTETLNTRLKTSFKAVSDQLENVYKSLGEMKELSTGVTDNVTALNRVLTNVKARGTWAEYQLESILDQTIPSMYEKNVATKSNSQKRVEFAVKIPDTDDTSKYIYLPIDSKFPMEDYVRLCDAADRADAQELAKVRKELENKVKNEAKAINEYINVPRTTPFAIMYLATEGLYAEIASSKSGLLEKLQREYNVMVAGPTTITALLNTLSMGFKTVAINEKANEVRKLLSAAKVQYDKFGIVLEKARKKIDEAGRTLDDAQKRNDIIKKKLRGVEDIEEAKATTILEQDSMVSLIENTPK